MFFRFEEASWIRHVAHPLLLNSQLNWRPLVIAPHPVIVSEDGTAQRQADLLASNTINADDLTSQKTAWLVRHLRAASSATALC